jgi:Arc/MetJ-type ribon-helix-helix transcriptional regulator
LADRPCGVTLNFQEHNELTIHLPKDLETSIKAMVHDGQFASVDEAMAEAARLLLREARKETVKLADEESTGSIGAMKDAGEELDQIVADAYKRRREEPWRNFSVE